MSHEGYAIVDVVQTKNKKVEMRKTILQPMILDFPGGCVTAIMGPSGSGKTTMLDFITGNMPSSVKAVGEVSLPGTNVRQTTTTKPCVIHILSIFHRPRVR